MSIHTYLMRLYATVFSRKGAEVEKLVLDDNTSEGEGLIEGRTVFSHTG